MAGGKSSRMKSDKALLPFEHYNSLAEYQYQRLLPFFDKVYISAKDDKFDFPIEIIKDCYTDASPLVALVSIFETLETEEIFILSVDAPFVSLSTIEELYSKADDKSSVIIAESNQGIEPLCGIYRRSMLSKAKEFLSEDNHRLQALLRAVDYQSIKIGEEKEFMNLNHPFEYEEAKKVSKKRLEK